MMRSFFILRWQIIGDEFPHTAAFYGARAHQDAQRRREELAADKKAYDIQIEEADPRDPKAGDSTNRGNRQRLADSTPEPSRQEPNQGARTDPTPKPERR
jgi:hypothetical protein